VKEPYCAEVNYHTLYTIVRTRFKAKLKVPRPLLSFRRPVRSGCSAPFRRPIPSRCACSAETKVAWGC
jgi:hypothetical protein